MTKVELPMQDLIPKQVLVSFIRDQTFYRPSDDDPKPLGGPLGPIVLGALQHTLWVLGVPIPWRMGFPLPWMQLGPSPEPWVQVALNPQPLPPRTLFFTSIAQHVVDRALLIQETADVLQSQGEQQGIIIVGGYVSRFTDDFELCPRIPWVGPGPRPNWLPDQVGGADLIVTGLQLQRAASQAFDSRLGQSFAEAGAKFVQAGVDKLQ